MIIVDKTVHGGRLVTIHNRDEMVVVGERDMKIISNGKIYEAPIYIWREIFSRFADERLIVKEDKQ